MREAISSFSDHRHSRQRCRPSESRGGTDPRSGIYSFRRHFPPPGQPVDGLSLGPASRKTRSHHKGSGEAYPIPCAGMRCRPGELEKKISSKRPQNTFKKKLIFLMRQKLGHFFFRHPSRLGIGGIDGIQFCFGCLEQKHMDFLEFRKILRHL